MFVEKIRVNLKYFKNNLVLALFEILISSALGGSIGVLGAYLITKKALKTEKIIEISEDLIDNLLNSEANQKKLYSMGLLLGSGVKQGIGLQPRGGKMKLQDLIMMGAAQWIQGGGLSGMLGQGLKAKPKRLEKKDEGISSKLGRV